MRTVIKGTKTVEEYKKLKSYMEQSAREYQEYHKNASKDWQEGT